MHVFFLQQAAEIISKNRASSFDRALIEIAHRATFLKWLWRRLKLGDPSCCNYKCVYICLNFVQKWRSTWDSTVLTQRSDSQYIFLKNTPSKYLTISHLNYHFSVLLLHTAKAWEGSTVSMLLYVEIQIYLMNIHVLRLQRFLNKRRDFWKKGGDVYIWDKNFIFEKCHYSLIRYL